MKYILSIFFLLFAFSVQANVVKKITIVGNNSISESTIKSIVKFKKDKDYTLSELNIIQKKLYETDFFQSVKLSLKNNILIINLVENPRINFFYINEIKNKERKKFIDKNLSLGVSKIYSENLLKKDIEFIKKIFLDAGYYNIQIKPEISKISNDLVNIILNINRNELLKIKNINFIGNKNFSNSVLKAVVSSSEYGWWKVMSNTNASQSRLDYDVFALKLFYLNNGFYDVQLTNADIEILNNNSANIVFTIQEGIKHFFSDFKIIDQYNFFNDKNIQDLNKIIKSTFNKEYSQSKISYLQEEINYYYTKKKIEFINLSIDLQKKDNKISANFIFTPSKRAYVDLINITGNSITEESVIRRNLTYSSGDSISKYKILKSEDKLKSLGIFEKVETKILDSKIEDKKNITIQVEEKPTGQISAGLGVGTDGSTVSSSIQERNLFGKGINVNSTLSLGTQKISGFADLEFPDFKSSNNTFIYSVYSRSTDFVNAGYKNKLIGNTASLRFDIYEDISFQPGFGIEYDKIDTNSDASDRYKSREGNYVGLKSFYNIYTDKRDSKFRPRNGHKIGFGQSLNMPGSDILQMNNFVYGTYYKPINKNYSFNLKAGINSINSLDNKDVKLSDRLFLNNSRLRGFESFGIGPKDGKDHVGGNYSYYSSISSTTPNFLPKKWNANSIVFFDTGNVWGVDYDKSFDSNKIRSSIGISLDWLSPIGPLSFTLAEPITYDNGDELERFNFKIGSTF